MKKFKHLLVNLTLLLMISLALSVQADETLPELKVNKNMATVSGSI